MADTRLREGTDRILEEMSMAHYTIFYHLSSAHQLHTRLESKATLPHGYDDVFFHMSAATEMVDRFLLVLCQVRQRVEGFSAPAPLTLDEVTERATDFHKRKYAKAYKGHLRTGRPVGVALHNVDGLVNAALVPLVTGDLVAKLREKRNEIRHYRNVLAHNPLIPMLVGDDNAIYLPRPGKLDEYDLWSTAFFGKQVETDYVAGPMLVGELLHEFETRMNSLWEELVGLLSRWAKSQEYAAMMPANSDAPGPDAPKPPTQPSTLSSTLSSSSGSGVSTMPTERRTIIPSGTASVSDLLDMEDQDSES